jgi:hypothetical protein
LGKKDGHGLISVYPFFKTIGLICLGFGYLVLLWYLCALSGEEGN